MDVAGGSISVGLATLIASMVAEPAGSIHLRGTVLASELSKAASMAGGEVFQEHTGMIKETQEVVMALGASIATKVIGSICARRNRLPTVQAEEPPENESPADAPEEKGVSSADGPKEKDEAAESPEPADWNPFDVTDLVTPTKVPEKHPLTSSPIRAASEPQTIVRTSIY